MSYRFEKIAFIYFALFGGIICFIMIYNHPWPNKIQSDNDLIEKRAHEIYIDYKAQMLVEERLYDEETK